jgi:UDP-N-acetylmuramyl pentapeptide phosphotransferase/UDP-N-acetylglucosamine-1-phosphate transferase
VAFGLAAFCTYLMQRPTARLRIMDPPHERSLHRLPTPRTGGIAIFLALCAGSAMTAAVRGLAPVQEVVFIGAASIALLGLVDDWKGLSVPARLLAQSTVAIYVTLGCGYTVSALRLPGMDLELHAALPVSVLGVVWMVNLYNFMDGMDGLAGLMGSVGFAGFGLLAALNGDFELAALAAIAAGSAIGFLVYNLPPARIFMGDSGSGLLGYLAAVLLLAGERHGSVPLWQGAMLFSPFIFDATYTLVRRLSRGEPVWRAHRAHLYQRLVLLGWGHARTLSAEGLLMCAAAAAALSSSVLDVAWQWALLASLVLLLGGFAALVSHLEAAAGRGFKS